MRLSGITRRSALLAALVLLPVLSGCGKNPFNPVVDPGHEGKIPDTTPPNDSPQNLMIRFETSYEFQDLQNYEALLTSDFRYTFSTATDRDLADRYPNWGRDDEVESSKHLFEGFTNSLGESFNGASNIDMTLYGVQYGPDFTHADSTTHYQRVVVTTVDMKIEVPGSPDPTIYQINARHEFYIVRGDAAVLAAGQEARTDRWYIRRWDDLSQPLTAVTRIASVNAGQAMSTPATWGSVKNSYFH